MFWFRNVVELLVFLVFFFKVGEFFVKGVVCGRYKDFSF